jgi:hypothetical protein
MSKKIDERLLIKKLESSKEKVYKSGIMKAKVLPEHPFRAVVSGSSGSGKTQLILNLLTNKHYYKDYFDIIFVLSPTAGELDDTYDAIKPKTKKENGKEPSAKQLATAIKKPQKETKVVFINQVKPEKLKKIMDINEQLIKSKGVENSPKLLLLYDDVVSDKKLMADGVFRHTFIASRHYNASVIICTQKYNEVPRVCRLQASAIMYFKGTESENGRIIDEFCPPSYNKKEFTQILHEATKEKYSFLFINCHDDIRTRYRKCLHSIIVLTKHNELKEVKDLDKDNKVGQVSEDKDKVEEKEDEDVEIKEDKKDSQ